MVFAGCAGEDPKVTVPNVVGLQEEHAVSLAQEAGLAVQVERRREATAQRGVVYEQIPAGGVEVAEGTTLEIRVSARAPESP